MLEEELKPFLEKVKENSSLLEKLKADSDAVVVMAQDRDAISVDDSKRDELRGNEWKTLSGGLSNADRIKIFDYFSNPPVTIDSQLMHLKAPALKGFLFLFPTPKKSP
ncbi:Nitrogen fixation protein of unknown function [Synechococcus sp. MIT S9509]|uniref:Nif11 family protein n=1 Tax=Synechococcus sp. MIT S9509 TaxID=1801630 RepID=UPI0007BC0BD2|nr:Nif11 family protein [Synechococcus sp. MIT S9509]KZR85826.1 Nitrogen fixation protein of unknown function [Synechococcus sp. MIT S9509]